MSVQQKLQKGRRLLDKAGNDSDLLGSALLPIHGALEDVCRDWLSAPSIKQQHGIDVQNKTKVNWQNILELMPRYCGWSDRDVRYVRKMNGLRIKPAHGDEFEGTRQDIEQYLNYVENAIAKENTVFDLAGQRLIHRKGSETARTIGENRFSRFWFIGTIIGFFIGVFLAFKLAAFLNIPIHDAEENEFKLSAFILMLCAGFGVGTLQCLLLIGKIKKAWHWIVATTVGYALPVILTYVIDLLLGKHDPTLKETVEATDWRLIVMQAATYGGFIGFCQWLVLRKYFRRAASWIVVSAISYGFGFVVLGGLNGNAFPAIAENKKTK